MNYDEWIRLGERLGLIGESLAAFIKEKESEFLDREERKLRREEERRLHEMQHKLQLKEKELVGERIRLTRPSIEGPGRTTHPILARGRGR
jgi:hypothetical protein